MVFLLNTACRDIDRELLKKLSTPTGNKYRFTCPVGRAWFTVFQYIYNNRGLIPWTAQNLDIVTNTLKTWTAKYETGETTGLAGRIALYLKSEIWKRERYPYTLRRDSAIYHPYRCDFWRRNGTEAGTDRHLPILYRYTDG